MAVLRASNTVASSIERRNVTLQSTSLYPLPAASSAVAESRASASR